MNRNLVFLLGAASCIACDEPDFASYNELDRLRVLAVRAEPAQLTPGESGVVDALVYDAGAVVTRRWSLCPWPSDPNAGFACPMTEGDWSAAWTRAGLEGTPLALDLGRAETAALSVPSDATGLRMLCYALLESLGASATTPPDCERHWDWTVRLVIESDAERVEAVKDVTLGLSSEFVPNQNPRLIAFRVRDGATQATFEGDSVQLPRRDRYALSVEVAEDAAETYLPRPVSGQTSTEPETEPLTFTWFTTAGSTERMRSTAREGVESLEHATKNELKELRSAAATDLFVVVRDQRGGVDWISGALHFAD